MAKKMMCGTVAVPMSELIASTVEVHGFVWAYEYYCQKHGFADWEFLLLAGAEVVELTTAEYHYF